MKYLSTRGGDERLSFEEAVLTGLAPNGGLYVPSELPQLPANWETEWASLSFTALALEIYSLFIDESEISRADLKALIEKSYSTFRHPEITPLRKTKDSQYVLELFHGPTFAFKDVALQFLGNLFEFFLERRNQGKLGEDRERLTVVGATSGDTGSAAIYGLRSKKDITIFITHPKGRVSPIQEAQMTTVPDANVFNLAVTGTFDDCQDIVKTLFSDKEFNTKYRLGAINSINWARILAQTVYYFASYFNLQAKLATEGIKGAKLQFVVPTGNFGDILAGYYAKKLGLPQDKLVVATNSNDILTRFWKTGIYEKADSGELGHPEEGAPAEAIDGTPAQSKITGGVYETLSPAMDILVSSNFERLLFNLALERATDAESQEEKIRQAQALLNSWMADVKTKGRVVVPKEVIDGARAEMKAGRAGDEKTLETIRLYYELGYVVDPHTAVGLYVANQVAPPNTNIVQVVLSTAHPAKFSEAVSDALKDQSAFNFEKDVLPKEFIGLLDKERRLVTVENNPEAVKQVVATEVERIYGA